MISRSSLSLLLLSLLSLAPLAAQTQPSTLQIRVRQQDNTFIVPNGSSLNVAATGVGKPVTLNVTVTYQGGTSALFSAPPALIGSTAFRFTSIGTLPVTLQPNGSLTFDVIYTPTTSAAAITQLTLGYTEAGATANTPATGGSILLNFAGTAPELSLSYALASNGNVIPIANGGVVAFDPTTVNTTSGTSILVVNRGSAPGPVTSVAITGEAFQLVSLPLLPTNLAANSSLQFGIRYTPRKLGEDRGTLQINYGGETATLSLQGTGIGSTFLYEITPEGGDSLPLQPNQTVAVPDTKVGERFSYTVQVRNTGTAPGVVNIITVSGTQFGLTDLPFLPFTLAPNEFLTFTLVFQPTQPGRITSRLRIGNDLFDFSGTGIGSRLTYYYSSGSGAPIQITSPGAVVFSPLQVGQTGTTRFEIRNEGTAPAGINSIGVADTRGVFRLQEVPALPTSIEPGGRISFPIQFSPAVTGLSTSQLLIDTQVFTLSGLASAPPPLPGFQFSGASGDIEPFQQPAIRLTLLDPYPLPLIGVLNLTVEASTFSGDPAVQFASGGRTVAFTIPANTREAVFPNGAREIRLQSGTVASTLTITPLFATQSGLELTPQPNTTLKLNVPRRAPSLVNLQIAARAADSLTLSLNGFTTTRSLRSAEVQFVARTGSRVAETRFTIDLSTVSTAWFRTSGSEAFGGQFSLLLPFSFSASTALTEPIINNLQSVSITVTNEIGTSERLSVNLQ